MDVGIILTELSSVRESYKVALELEERFNERKGVNTDLIDLMDFQYPDFESTGLGHFIDSSQLIILVGSAQRPVYGHVLHYLLDLYHQQFSEKCANSAFVGEHASKLSLQLQQTLKDMGAYCHTAGLAFQDVSDAFDYRLNLRNEQIRNEMEAFITGNCEGHHRSKEMSSGVYS
ncbi:MAG: hypothetical protein RIC80_16780 [Cyclobacteriaceae bacterium]